MGGHNATLIIQVTVLVLAIFLCYYPIVFICMARGMAHGLPPCIHHQCALSFPRLFMDNKPPNKPCNKV